MHWEGDTPGRYLFRSVEKAKGIGLCKSNVWACLSVYKSISFMNSQVFKGEKAWSHFAHWGRFSSSYADMVEKREDAGQILSFRGWKWLYKGCPQALRSLWLLHITNPNKRIGSLQGLLWEPPLQTGAAAGNLMGEAADRWWERQLRSIPCWKK